MLSPTGLLVNSVGAGVDVAVVVVNAKEVGEQIGCPMKVLASFLACLFCSKSLRTLLVSAEAGVLEKLNAGATGFNGAA